MFSCDKEGKPSFDEKPSSSFSGKKIKTHTLYYYEIENRLALVITGKGQRLAVSDGWKGTGVLKKNLPKWLNSLAISSKVLWYGHAPQEKGGSGAMLVYLKKKITK